MDQSQLAVAVLGFVAVLLCLTVFFLTRALVNTNRESTAYFRESNRTTLEHALAISSDERMYMQMRVDADKQEFLLRELRAKSAREAAALALQTTHRDSKIDPHEGADVIVAPAALNGTLDT